MAVLYAPDLPIDAVICPTCGTSDHGSFWDAGFTAIDARESWEPIPPQIHTSGDTLGLINLELLRRVARVATATVATLAEFDTTAAGVIEDDIGGSPAGGVAPSCPRLSPPRPNPFVSSTTFLFGIPLNHPFDLSIHDPAGRLVRRIVRGVGTGRHQSATWDGRDEAGSRVPAGVYFYKLEVHRSWRREPQARVSVPGAGRDAILTQPGVHAGSVIVLR